MKQLVIYVHGKGGSAAEADHYKPLFVGSDVIGFDYKAQTPWEAVQEFPAFLAAQCRGYDRVLLIANSIGAFFSMCGFSGVGIDRALFISPVVDMERLITDMMGWANVTEDNLHEHGEIPTAFGETLSWAYLSYVRTHPVIWNIPTQILYGELDNLTAYKTISAFAERHDADITVMPGGEHWFHTEEQMAFLDAWIKEKNHESHL